MYIIKSGISDMRSGIKRKTEQPNPSGDYSTASSSATGECSPTRPVLMTYSGARLLIYIGFFVSS